MSRKFRLLNSVLVFGLQCVFLSSCSSSRDVGQVGLLSLQPSACEAGFELKAVKRIGRGSTLQEAIMSALKHPPGGMFIMNVEIRIVRKKKVEVTGDIWGPANDNKSDSISSGIVATPIQPLIAIGDRVLFSLRGGRRRKGKIVGFKQNLVIVEVAGPRRFGLYLALPANALTRY